MHKKIVIIIITLICLNLNLIYGVQSNVSGGINLTYDLYNTTSNDYDYFYNLTLDKIPINYTNFDLGNANYSFNNFMFQDINYTIRYDPTVVTSASTILCSGQSINSLFNCNFTLNNNVIITSYYVAFCNQNNVCGTPGRLIQPENFNQISGGVKLIGSSYSNTTSNNYSYFYNFTLDTIPINYTNFDLGYANYSFNNFIFQDINYTIRYDPTVVTSSSTILCSGQSISGLFNCNFTLNNNNIIPSYYVALCNQNNVCGNAGRLIQPENFNQISGGVKLTGESFINITTNYPIEYYTPTPENNMRKYNIENITIKIYDGNYNLDSCKVTINDLNYTMTYDNTYCTYTYAFNSSNITQSITFQGHYNYSSLETSLEQRIIYIYPVKINTNPMPAYGIFSLLLSLLILLGGFIFN